MPNEPKYFADDTTNGLDADSDLFAIPLNEVINMQDCRIGSTDKGVTATVESVGGTLLLSAPSPSISFIEIGNIIDDPGNRIIYFYYNLNTSLHKIEVYDKTAGVIYLVLLSSQITGGLNFNKDYPIHSGRIESGYAYWTDDYNPPRVLNIDAAIKMNNPTYVTSEVAYTNPLEEEVISLIRKPPTMALRAGKFNNPAITVNNITNFAGQFSVRYIFRNGAISVLATPSNLINFNTVSEVVLDINYVLINWIGTEHIPQDVVQVDFCVRYGNGGNYFVIRSWNKNIAADAAAIIANNAGIFGLQATFLNDRIGIALDSAYSVKPYDNVPLLSEALEISLNRLFLGNNLVSYNSPVLTSLVGTMTTDTNHTPFQNPVFKAFGIYKIGIVFRDRYKRVVGNVFTSDTLKIQIPDRDYNLTSYVKAIAWTLSNTNAVNEIPYDAESYCIVITKNLQTRFFIDSKAAAMKYAIKNPITGLITYQDTYTSGAYGLAFDASYIATDGMGYQFTEGSGDLVRIYQNASATKYTLPVIAQDGSYVITKLQDLGSFATQPNIVFEIYTPYFEVGDDPYYTTGDVLLISNPHTNSRTYGLTGGNIYGDVYLYDRFTPTGTYTAENMSPIPAHWKEWLGNWGEININTTSKQVRKKTSVVYSNVIIEGTDTNGLNTFEALNEKILPMDIGAMYKLQQTSKVQEQGNIMLAIGENQTASLYLGEVQVVGADQNAFVASSPNVIGTINVLKGNFGTTMPTSVLEYRGMVIWYDLNAGRIIQYASNGLFPISNYKMTRFWKQWAIKFQSMTKAQIEAFGDRPFVFAIVDPAHDEALFSLPKLADYPPKGYIPDYPTHETPWIINNFVYPFDPLDFLGKTMAYDLKYSRWRGSFSFVPEGFSTLQNQLYSFKSGQLYLHNQQNQCQYYGVQYYPKVMCVSNKEPTLPKSYNSIAVRSNIVPSFTFFYNLYPYQQGSDLIDYDYRDVEGVWYANIRRNIYKPTATGHTADGLLTAEKMRSTAMMVMFLFSVNTVPLELKFVDFNFSISLGHNPKNSR